MGEKGHNTNLAAEFYALSMLYRMGAEANLTLGNKKAVDIVVLRDGRVLTADVKGLKDNSCFPIDGWKKKGRDHFLIFITFRGRIDDPQSVPEVYVVPSLELESARKELDGKSVIYVNPKGNRRVVELSRLRKIAAKYKDKWDYFLEEK